MDANPEVMPAIAKPATRQVPLRGQREAQTDAPAAVPPQVAVDRGPRLSEDPMRRTDRYRLVMPYSLRV